MTDTDLATLERLLAELAAELHTARAARNLEDHLHTARSVVARIRVGGAR